MASRSGAELGAFIPWLARSGQRWKVVEVGGGVAPLFQAEGGRRGRCGPSGPKG
jgi:hypothetical protein